MYHRIADDPIDPWRLAVSADHFGGQLEVLQRTRRPVSLTTFVRGLQSGTLSENAVAVTFDDGYADNLFAGKPRLAAADVPAMVFLATGYLGRPGQFWWDELARLILCTTEAQTFQIAIRGTATHFDLGDEPPLASTASWRAPTDPGRSRRQAAYASIWRACRSLDEGQREEVLAALRQALNGQVEPPGHSRPLTNEEARLLMRDGLVEIGAHSVTHPLLSEVDDRSLYREIADSKVGCEALSETEITAFAYPYGDFNPAVRSAVAAAGFTHACSTIPGTVSSRTDVFALPRIQVLDWDGDKFERALDRASHAMEYA